MKCEDVVRLLKDTTPEADRDGRRAAEKHLGTCDGCQSAMFAVGVLEAARSVPVPSPTPGAFERALLKATQRPQQRAFRGSNFWWGVGVGGALAAAITVTLLAVLPMVRQPAATAAPGVTIALYETRDVNITLDSPVALANAEIRIVLNGAIGLQGFDGQRELRWSTDLVPGVNQLTLPVVALGTDGGQLRVEVQHEDKRRTFIVDVRTSRTPGLDEARRTGA